MAPQLGPDANTRTILLGLGKSAHGRTATFYTDAAATSLATILTYDGTGTPGVAVSGSQLTIDADSQLPLTWFPDGSDTLYVRVNGLAGIKKVNADYDARLDAQAPLASPTFTGTVSAAAVAITGAAAGTDVVTTKVTADTQQRLIVDADGTHLWGSGSAAGDTNLYRSAADTLKTDDALHVAGAFRHLGSTAGFFNAAAVSKPTGVTVDAAGIHAALVTLGLIGA
jgi:hypothetical protein